MSNIQLVDIPNGLLEITSMAKRHPKNWIKELREDRHLTLDKLAEMVGVTNPYISMLEKSKRGLSWDMVQRLSAAFKCHPLEITEGPAEGSRQHQEKILLNLFRGLSDAAQEKLIGYAEGVAEAAAAAEKKKGSS
jgi:transcriptional regulator with XRE-family HTH domain